MNVFYMVALSLLCFNRVTTVEQTSEKEASHLSCVGPTWIRSHKVLRGAKKK